MQVMLDSCFARKGSVPIWGGKKGEFRDWFKIKQILNNKIYIKKQNRLIKHQLFTSDVDVDNQNKQIQYVYHCCFSLDVA